MLSVPNLSELVVRLRDPACTRCVTLIHAKRDGEGEWVLANAAARLSRGNIKVFGPELGAALIVHKAAALGIKPVGTIRSFV